MLLIFYLVCRQATCTLELSWITCSFNSSELKQWVLAEKMFWLILGWKQLALFNMTHLNKPPNSWWNNWYLMIINHIDLSLFMIIVNDCVSLWLTCWSWCHCWTSRGGNNCTVVCICFKVHLIKYLDYTIEINKYYYWLNLIKLFDPWTPVVCTPGVNKAAFT